MKIDTAGRKELFRARTGSHNYNLNDETSDEDWKVFVLPTFEDLYEGKIYSSPTHVDKELDYSVKDIRFFAKQIYKANITFLEVLYSDKVIVNPDLDDDTKGLINKIFEMRDRLVRVNLSTMYKANIGMYNQRVRNMSKGSISTKYLVDKYGYCTKNAMHGFRYLDFINRFVTLGDFGSALRYSEKRYKKHMLDIKRGSLGTYEQAKEFLNEIYNIIDEEYGEFFSKFEVDQDTLDELNDLIKEIVKSAWR